jgi:hypothetical protein
MPIRSQAQYDKLIQLVNDGKMTRETLKKMEADTPNLKNLPSKVPMSK